MLNGCIYYIFLSKINGEAVSGVFSLAARQKNNKQKQDCGKLFVITITGKVFFGPPQAKKISGFFSGYKSIRVQIK